MAITIINPTNAFIRFNEAGPTADCIWGDISFCLPVYADSDIAFQFVVQGTESEINALCEQDAGEVSVAIINECDDAPLLTFTQKPDRFRLSLTQMLYNWEHGLPNFQSVISIAECFKVQVTVGGVEFCSNCFERISDECYTAVVEYGNDEDAFGFKYCYAGDIDGETTTSCEPTIVQFFNVPTLAIPYTASLEAAYGAFPTVQVWIYDDLGQLVNMGITVAFDIYPPTMINLDFGGNATGIVVIR